ncbi:MAG: tetratricopeptide repeat protein [Thiofilum sp.]|uniref:tetratricopeptide repeat protein n=1 Tax=Thiofilum sp. TaxID=2212733 RepID=UPI0025E75873|nr:tetratricopeptide repeat protein [Thiofilum sp.]MBK8454213.1 tetratricopeptide repeat protein [Thiofilum sp.]
MSCTEKNKAVKDLPDTLEEMQTLFRSIEHGCLIGLQQEILDNIVKTRIQRGDTMFLNKRIGAFSDALSVVAKFFENPWIEVSRYLDNDSAAYVLNNAGFNLRGLGRLTEALEPMLKACKIRESQKNWRNAAINHSNISELLLCLGKIDESISHSEKSVKLSDQSLNPFHQMGKRTTLADALHEANFIDKSYSLFNEALKYQIEWMPDTPFLNALAGYRFNNLLLTKGDTDLVLQNSMKLYSFDKENKKLLGLGLYSLLIGSAYLKKNLYDSSLFWLNHSVISLHSAGQKIMLPRGLIARATLHRHTNNFKLAHQDLQEVYDIAEPSGMRLHLTDYHLEMARLLLAENTAYFYQATTDYKRSPQYHINEAERLIKATGYHRRDQELTELKQTILTPYPPSDLLSSPIA